MASRREQKEARRRERLAREQEAARAEHRRRVLGRGVGAALGIAAVGGIVVAIVAGGGSGGGGPRPAAHPRAKVPIPAQRITNLGQAASAAGCSLRTFVPGSHDQDHVNGTVTYKQNPPVFGPHNPVPAHDGDYAGQSPPPTEQLVHPLEHGRVVIWYRPTLSTRQIGQVETLFAEPFRGNPSGYKQILVARPNMPFQVAASSWGQQLGCPRFNDKVFDALRTFRASYVDHAPEQVPFPE